MPSRYSRGYNSPRSARSNRGARAPRSSRSRSYRSRNSARSSRRKPNTSPMLVGLLGGLLLAVAAVLVHIVVASLDVNTSALLFNIYLALSLIIIFLVGSFAVRETREIIMGGWTGLLVGLVSAIAFIIIEPLYATYSGHAMGDIPHSSVANFWQVFANGSSSSSFALVGEIIAVLIVGFLVGFIGGLVGRRL